MIDERGSNEVQYRTISVQIATFPLQDTIVQQNRMEKLYSLGLICHADRCLPVIDADETDRCRRLSKNKKGSLGCLF